MTDENDPPLDEKSDEKRANPAGRRDYDDIAQQIGLYTKNTERRLTKFFKGALIAFAIIGLCTAGALVGFGVVLKAQQNTADQLADLVKANQDFAKAIQDQRRESIRTSCQAQNERNKATRDALTEGSDEDIRNAQTEAAKNEIRRRRDVTIALIDALAPRDNCEEAVRRAVKGG